MNRRVLIAVLAVLALPAPARAATQVNVQQVQGLDIVVANDDDTAGTIDTTLGVDENTQAHFVAVKSAGGATTANCQSISADTVACVGDYDAIVVLGNGGDDRITLDLIADGLPPLHGEALGHAGNDTLKTPPDGRDVPQPDTYFDGGVGTDSITGGNGADEIHGGEGNDTIEANQGADKVYGEGGDDSVSGGKEDSASNAADVLDGGPGSDQTPDLVADYERGFNDQVSVTLDNQANDGEPNEGDNVIAVEKFRLRGAQVTFVGSDAAEDVFVEADSSTIKGLGGNDRLVAYDGSDTLEGGDGDDFLEGGFGNDVLDGGGGVDEFRGDRTERDVIATGNDQIRARDGLAEQVNCGIGSDSAQVDAGDVVDPSCESVDRPAAPAQGGGGGGGGGAGSDSGSGPGAPGKPIVLGRLSIRRIAALGLQIRIACPAACSVGAQLLVDRRTAARLGLGRSRVLARGRASLNAPGDARVTLKVVRRAIRRFRRLRRARVTLKTSTTIAGTATRSTQVLRLKR